MAQQKIYFKPSPKQSEIFKLFDDKKTTDVLYGGSVGSGKSFLLASLIVMKSLQHTGIRIGVARNSLTNLKKTTLVSILEVMENWGLTPEKHYKYNSQAGTIKFFNGSEILLVELSYLPSDPNFTRLGGLLLTFGVIDEAGEVDEKGKEIFQTRLGRWKNEDMGIKPFILMTCNPTKNFLYREYYVPSKDGTLANHRAFVQALPADNPYLPAEYITNLERTLTLPERRRLLCGDWEFTEDDTNLFLKEDVDLMYDLSIELEKSKVMRMSCDIAFTSDKCIFIVWEGTKIIDIISKDNKNDKTVVDVIKDTAVRYGVKTNNICYDADGVGKYIRQYLPSAKEIHNNGKTIMNHGYRNLKTELYFKLSQMVREGRIKIRTEKFQYEIEEELAVVKHKTRETMTKIEITSKAEQKRLLGRSPDIADAMAYGMIFQLKQSYLSSSDMVYMDF